MPLQKPSLSTESVLRLLSDLYGLKNVSACIDLPGERDQNFKIDSEQGQFVLKVFSADENEELLIAQSQMLQRLAPLEICPAIKFTLDGLAFAQIDVDSESYWVRMVSYLEGRTLSSIRYKSPKLLRDLGHQVARLNDTLSGFDHPALHYDFDWCLGQGVEVVSENRHLVNDAELGQWLDTLMDRFQRHTVPLLSQLPKNVIHNDVNDGNVIVDSPIDQVTAESLCGIIDLGDATYSWVVGDLAVAVAYAILESPNPLLDAAEIVKSYHLQRPLSCVEVDSIFGLVCLRLCLSVCMAAKQSKVRPDDEYLRISQEPIKRTLPTLVEIPFQVANGMFRDACGFPVHDSYDKVTSWIRDSSDQLSFVLRDFRAETPLVLIDWSVESQLQDDVLHLDLEAADRKIAEMLDGGKIGVGRYREPRLVYASEQFASEGERRTIHLGVDLFANAGAEVVAPFGGIVVVLHEIKKELDYGTLLILQHETGDGDCFYTLYGHLDWESTKHLSLGAAVKRGEVMARLGSPEVNGGWSPHLHFQVLLEQLDFVNDFPGVAKPSEVGVWSRLCPNPNLMLGLPDSLTTYPEKSVDELRRHRKERLGANLSVGYRNPVNVVRGKAQYLFDQDGRKFLDAYNNVPHVGHCHPKVIEAAGRQMRLVNTNTRYLHENILSYSESLAATMPDPLNVCYILNSASEANELALRMMRCVTGAKDLMVLEGAYHGHTSGLIEISPYKHDGPGGEGRPDWVHVAPVADVFRGEFRKPETAGMQYAERLGEVCDDIKRSGRKLSGFIAESCPSVGGQILFPEGYLAGVYEIVRGQGGLCVADDVQTGFGRLGNAFYGFELQGVVPDIVVLGKPIGNGHPLAALVTTSEIAEQFNNGMEFFSTFGGNNVSCAVGKAVLEVVEEESLQEHAFQVGEKLLTGLRELQKRFDIIADVRGSGFFLGVELVRNLETLEPADREASFVSNRMRDHGVLIGTDGPLHNVLKIRPPMPFSHADASHLLEVLATCIEELY